MSTARSRPAQLSHMHPPKSSSLSSLSSYLPMSPPVASSSTLSYFPPFVPSEPPIISTESSHRKNRSLSAIAGWSLNLSFGLGSSSGSSTPEHPERARPPTPAQALSSSLHRPRHSTSSTRHLLQPVVDQHSHIKRSQSLRQSDRARSKRPARDDECGVERDRRRGMELLLGVLGSKANGSEESLLDVGKENTRPQLEASEPRAHGPASSSSTASVYATSVATSPARPARPPFRPINTTPHPGLRRANSARTHTQPPCSFRPLPQLSARRPKPHLRLSLTHPSWSRPSPSPPVTSLSPSLPSELFDFCVDNPITPPISACHSPTIGGPLERTVSETETLRPSILTPRPLRQQSARPPPVEASSESESEDGELKTPCLSSSPVMADLQLPTINNPKRPTTVKEVRKAPWR